MIERGKDDTNLVARSQFRAAWIILLWQSLLPAFWPCFGVALGFIALALFDVLPMLWFWGHIAVLALFLIALALAFAHGLRRAEIPTKARALRQIETASGLTHRPLSTLEDSPLASADDDAAASLWAAHRRRIKANLGRLRVGWPTPALAVHDPYGLRIVLILLVFVAWISAGNEAAERLRRAVMPDSGGGIGGQPITADLWITPPAYTGAAPIYLSSRNAAAATSVGIPEGSVLLAQVHGTTRRPKLTIDGVSPGKFAAMDASDYALTAKLIKGETLQLRAAGSTLARYKLSIIRDAPPQVHFTKPPRPTVHSALGIAYDAQDDYGVTSVTLEVRQALESRDATDTGPNAGAPITVVLPAPTPAERNVHGLSFTDLTADPLAGQAVELRLVAVDNAGQAARSDPIVIMLPERVFHNPLARLIVDQRKLLITGSENPGAIAQNLLALTKQTEPFGQDTIAFLGVNVAAHQLFLDQSPDSRGVVAALLWDAALRIEDGSLSGAQRSMRQAEEALQDALARNAPGAEIEQLMRKFQQQVAHFLQSLAQQGAAHPSADQSSDSASRSIDMSDIQKLLDRAHELARTGDTAGAREALAQLQEMLESLRATQGQGMSAAGQEALRNMQALQHRQQQLMDQTFQSSRQGDGQAGQEADAQNTLRRALDQLMKGQAGKGQTGNAQSGKGEGGDDQLAPDLQRAERAMQDAEAQLKQGEAGAALGPQGDALDALQQAGREMARQMSKGGEDGQSGSGQGSHDPFGRNPNGHGMVDRGDVVLPTKSDLQRSREILDELRRREGDFTRPREERNYLDRLLKSF